MSKPLIEKLGIQPTASLSDNMKYVSGVDDMLNTKKQPMQVTFKQMGGDQRDGCSRRKQHPVLLCLWRSGPPLPPMPKQGEGISHVERD